MFPVCRECSMRTVIRTCWTRALTMRNPGIWFTEQKKQISAIMTSLFSNRDGEEDPCQLQTHISSAVNQLNTTAVKWSIHGWLLYHWLIYFSNLTSGHSKHYSAAARNLFASSFYWKQLWNCKKKRYWTANAMKRTNQKPQTKVQPKVN